jgi:hypothetical protein
MDATYGNFLFCMEGDHRNIRMYSSVEKAKTRFDLNIDASSNYLFGAAKEGQGRGQASLNFDSYALWPDIF